MSGAGRRREEEEKKGGGGGELRLQALMEVCRLQARARGGGEPRLPLLWDILVKEHMLELSF